MTKAHRKYTYFNKRRTKKGSETLSTGVHFTPVDKAPMKEEWALNIKQQTETCGAAFFFKQWGTWGSDGIKRNKHANGKVLGGRVVQQMPE